MRLNYPNLDPASAFPTFVMNIMNPWMGGIVLATLLVAVVGTGAGLALGVGTIFTKDIYKNYINKKADDKQLLKVTRIMIIVILGLTLVFVSGNVKSLILKWSFMSMGLRGATVFAPLCAALFLKGKVKPSMAICSMFLGPLSVLFGEMLLPESIDPLYLGIVISFMFIIIGLILETRKLDNDIKYSR